MMLSRMPHLTRERTLGWTDAPCPLCRETMTEVRLEAADPVGTDGLVFSVVRCLSCDLHYTNPRPDEASIGRFYPENYKPHRAPKTRPSVSRPRFGWFTGRDCPERRGELGVPPGRLLDFGCGGGSYLARMAARGWQVTGLDNAPETVDRIRKDLKFDAHIGTLPHEDLQPASFDAVTMWHSLEHVHDPVATLRSAFQLLVPGGLLLIAVPNIESAPARWFGADWFGLDLPRHLTHFTADTLREMLAVCGFEVKTVRGVKHSDWLRSSAHLATRRGQRGLLPWALRWKLAAKFAGWLTYALGRCDCLLVVGTRPAE